MVRYDLFVLAHGRVHHFNPKAADILGLLGEIAVHAAAHHETPLVQSCHRSDDTDVTAKVVAYLNGQLKSATSALQTMTDAGIALLLPPAPFDLGPYAS